MGSRKGLVKVSASVILGLTVLGCGRTVNTISNEATPASEATLATLNAGEAPALPVTTIAAASEDGIGIQLSPGPDFTKVIVQTNGAEPVFNVSRLTAPDRLVVDLLGTPSRVGRVFQVADARYVSQIRLGAHADKSRLVFDLTSAPGLTHSVNVVDGNLTVAFGTAETIARLSTEGTTEAFGMPRTAIAPTGNEHEGHDGDETKEEHPEGEKHDATHLSSNEHGDSSGDAEKHEHEEHGATHRAPEAVAALGTSVAAVRFESDEAGGNMVVASLSKESDFTFTKSAPSEYVLRIAGAGIDSSVGTLIATPKDGMIRSVRPAKSGNDVLLRIFAQPEARLAARTEGANIVVVARAGAVDATDVRAQLKKEEGKKEDHKEVEVKEGSEDKAPAVTSSTVSAILEEKPTYTGRLISLDLQDTDIDNALRIIAEVSNLNIIASDDVTGKVTLRLIDVPWDQALDVILKTNGLDKVRDGNVIRIAPVDKLRAERESLKQAQQAEEELEALKVKYIRINYAKASELKPLVEAVLSERGSVAHDERSNQLIVKDIQKGIVNVAELVSKLDLRTPQVLLETQIVEANRSLFRDLGAQLDFSYIESPATGNPTGHNFPNSVSVGGSLPNGGGASSFPATVSDLGGSAVSFLFGSADGTRALDTRLSALEREGRVRIVSRPSVATINNKQAQIKSVEKIRIKLPDSGTTVGIGGAGGTSVSGGSSTATEVVEIGIVLEMTPQASPDYYVLLDINAKSSTLGSTFVDGIPSEIERAATSSVLVSSGQTFALGGIYKITDQDRITGVPFFKDIPFLGHLFRNSNVNNFDEELIFFITPRIVEGSFDDAAMKMAS